MQNDNFDIANTTKGKLPRLPFLEMKEKVLGKKYSLSLVFVGETRSRTITKKYKNKDKVSNVLSFPLSKTEGEIIITPKLADREAKKLNTTLKKYVGFLFIHGLLHLSGLRHGSRLNSKEQILRKQFGV